MNLVATNTIYSIAGGRGILCTIPENKASVMPTATLNLTLVSRRMLTRREAAEHCGRPLKMFEVECPVPPVKFANGDLRWDVRDLDVWLDTLKTGADALDAIVDRLT